MNRILIFLFVSVIILSSAGKASAFAKGEQECSKCHTLTEEQAKKVLGDVVPSVKILSIQPGPFQGIWEVGFESNGQKSIAYLDYSLKYLVARATVLSLRDKKNLTEESFLKISRVDLAGFPYKNALVMGDRDAKHKIIVFDDPD